MTERVRSPAFNKVSAHPSYKPRISVLAIKLQA